MKLALLLLLVIPLFLGLAYLWFTFERLFWWWTWLSVGNSLAVVSWTLGYALWDLINRDKVEAPEKKAVLVTGCDTGFGHETAIKLDRFGFTVFAGVLRPEGEGANKLVASCSKRLRLLKMDITKQWEVEQAFQTIEGSGLPLWAIVNNAGIGVSGFLDWGHDVDEYRKVFEVNVFGLVRVTKRAMPLLRETPGSRLVNVSSLSARAAAPNLGHYCMSKHAVRAFSDVLRRELSLSQSPVSVVMVEPTFYRTGIIEGVNGAQGQERLWSTSPDAIKAAYSAQFFTRQCLNQAAIDRSCRRNLHEVVDTLVAAVTLKNPKLVYRCCGYTDLGYWALSIAPEIILDTAFTLRELLFVWSASWYKEYTLVNCERSDKEIRKGETML